MTEKEELHLCIRLNALMNDIRIALDSRNPLQRRIEQMMVEYQSFFADRYKAKELEEFRSFTEMYKKL